ncbi:MAG: hypothetical protein ACTICC_10600 [Lactiplantibacillus plantarum]
MEAVRKGRYIQLYRGATLTIQVDNQWPEIDKQFDILNKKFLAVGFFSDSAESKLLTIVRANEFSAHIQPKNGEWLTIPTKDTPVGGDGGPMPAREIPGLFRPKGKNVLAVPSGNGFKIVYILVKEVNIPARPFIRTAKKENEDKYRRMVMNGIGRIIDRTMSATELLNILGETAVNDIRRQMVTWSDPGNAPATIARKGTNNPLVDKGILARSVSYRILEGWHD